MNASRSFYRRVGLPALLLLFLGAVGAGAATYNLSAEALTLTLPDGASVPAWGYRDTDTTDPASVPGTVIRVPAGEDLVINLTNALPSGDPTSLQILGQAMADGPTPTYVDGRVMSFVKETAAGATVQYSWIAPRPGTYMLQSATNPAKQVQMGLFAAVIVEETGGTAYGHSFGDERILVFHEVDPVIQAAIANGTYGPGGTITSSVFRHPVYYLINGAGYPDTSLDPIAAGQTLLLRFVNGGLETHAPVILNKYLSVVAQDGIAKAHPQETYGFELNAAGTIDALVAIGSGDAGSVFPIHDGRNRYLTNAGLENTGSLPSEGGMIVHLEVAAAGPNTAPVASADSFGGTAGTPLNVTAPGVLANDSDDQNDALTAVLHSGPTGGSLTLNGDGSFSFDATTTGTYSFEYVASDGALDSAPATVTINLTANTAPTAAADAFNGTEGQALNVPSPGVLANDSDPEGQPLTATLNSGPANGSLNLNPDGAFTYTPNAGFSGADSFTYTAGDGALSSPAATVSLSINDLPVASADSYSTDENVDLVVTAPGVMANDSDNSEGELTATLVSSTSNGVLSFSPDGGFTYQPAFGFSGSDSFTYEVTDALGAASAAATATITVNNVNDTVTITRLRWRNGQTRVRIIAESSAPAGTVTLTAAANFGDGGAPQVLGVLPYKPENGDYRETLPFDTTRGLPDSITVSSSQGGSDTQGIPFP